MDYLRAPRYPFLKEASALVAERNISIEDLVISSTFEDARKRGMERVSQAIDRHEVDSIPLLQEHTRLIEVLSYPYARMIVSSLNDRFLTKRYALAEASHMAELLMDDKESSLVIANELDVKSNREMDGTITMHFTDYLRFSHVMKAVDWKLINREVKKGMVSLEQDKFDRLLQNALQEKIESEIPLKIPDAFKQHLQRNANIMGMELNDMKARLNPTQGKGMEMEFLPPCMKAILASAQNGLNLPHSARFALVSFLNALGLGYDEIIQLFAQSPDFDESKSGYQIKHIIGEGRGGEGYTPPGCSAMTTNGICYNPDDICGFVKHPLGYYRMRSNRGKATEP